MRDAKLMYLQNQLFRTAGSGGFEALTQAVAKDGAMMVWLDTATDKKAHPNENFAREMMELFTLGIGNYTQADVTAAARAFTGWVYDRVDYRYAFRPRQHDFGSKTYLGQTGDWNGEDIVHIAVTRPESARFVLAKLWSHFAYPVQPSDQVVDDLLPAYGPGLDVGAALRAIFLHPAFLGADNPARAGQAAHRVPRRRRPGPRPRRLAARRATSAPEAPGPGGPGAPAARALPGFGHGPGPDPLQSAQRRRVGSERLLDRHRHRPSASGHRPADGQPGRPDQHSGLAPEPAGRGHGQPARPSTAGDRPRPPPWPGWPAHPAQLTALALTAPEYVLA